MNIGYPDTKNKQGSGDCGCGSPLYAKYDDVVPEVTDKIKVNKVDVSGITDAIRNKRKNKNTETE